MASSAQDCDCGFVDSDDPTKSIFSSFFLANFSSITNSQYDDFFIPASYEINPRDSPYNRNYLPSQIQLSDAGLHLNVSPPASNNSVPCAQLFTRASSFFYGSYHVRTRVGGVPGTVSAFFNYKSDSSEVDIEYLSAWDDPTLLYTVKPQIYTDSGNPVDRTYQREEWNGTGTFDQDFHDWSFVWLPDIVHFALDAKYSRSISTNVPQAPGRLSLSHWSDGNPKYSLGPPTQASSDTISLLWAVYNETATTTMACKKTTSACTISSGYFQQPSSVSSGGSTNAPTLLQATIINSAHGISPVAPNLLLALLFFSWFLCSHSR